MSNFNYKIYKSNLRVIYTTWSKIVHSRCIFSMQFFNMQSKEEMELGNSYLLNSSYFFKMPISPGLTPQCVLEALSKLDYFNVCPNKKTKQPTPLYNLNIEYSHDNLLSSVFIVNH